MEKDISSIFQGISLVEKTAKSGNKYHVLRATFSDGDKVYTVDNFVSPDQLFILNTMLDTIK